MLTPIKTNADERHADCVQQITKALADYSDTRMQSAFLVITDENGEQVTYFAGVDRVRQIGLLFTLATKMAQDNGGF